MEYLANHGPLVAAVDASSWQDYLGGIIQYHCSNNKNHAVQIVGYNLKGNWLKVVTGSNCICSKGDIPYYIVRNTWGRDFGIEGYLHIAIGKNLCGIAEEVSALDVLF